MARLVRVPSRRTVGALGEKGRGHLASGRWRRAVCAVVVGAASGGSLPVGVAAAGVPVTAVCTFQPGQLNLSLSNPVGVATTQPVTLAISGSGSCAGNGALANTVSVSMVSSAVITCEAGLGGVLSLSGMVTWNTPQPSASTFSGVLATGPYDIVVVMDSTAFTGAADFAWTSPEQIISCASGGTSTAQLGGVMSVVETG